MNIIRPTYNIPNEVIEETHLKITKPNDYLKVYDSIIKKGWKYGDDNFEKKNWVKLFDEIQYTTFRFYPNKTFHIAVHLGQFQN